MTSLLSYTEIVIILHLIVAVFKGAYGWMLALAYLEILTSRHLEYQRCIWMDAGFGGGANSDKV